MNNGKLKVFAVRVKRLKGNLSSDDSNAKEKSMLFEHLNWQELKLRKRIKHSPSFAHVLNKTLNLDILRCCFPEEGKEIYPSI